MVTTQMDRLCISRPPRYHGSRFRFLGYAVILAGALLTLERSGAACGRWGGGNRGKGVGLRPCMHALMHMSDDALKSELGLDRTQIKRFKAIQKNLFNKASALKNDIQTAHAEMKALWQNEKIEQQSVLGQVRKIRGLRGRLQEERVKAHLKILNMVAPEKRSALHKKCRDKKYSGSCTCGAHECGQGCCGGECGSGLHGNAKCGGGKDECATCSGGRKSGCKACGGTKGCQGKRGERRFKGNQKPY